MVSNEGTTFKFFPAPAAQVIPAMWCGPLRLACRAREGCFMYVALLSGVRVTAADAARGGDYRCPACGESVIYRNGPRVSPHFAHRHDSTCGYGSGESAEHERIKHELFTGLRGRARRVEAEWTIGHHRVDVAFKTTDGARVAVEVQCSSIPEREIVDRVNCYTANGWAVVWVLPPLATPPTSTDELLKAPRYMCALANGRIFTHVAGNVVRRVMIPQRGGADDDVTCGIEHGTTVWTIPGVRPMRGYDAPLPRCRLWIAEHNTNTAELAQGVLFDA